MRSLTTLTAAQRQWYLVTDVPRRPWWPAWVSWLCVAALVLLAGSLG
jgi:hypothetical protein